MMIFYPGWYLKLHRYRRGQGNESRASRNFLFRLSFRNYKSCVYNCHDHPSFNSSLRSSHHMIFIYSKLQLKKKLSCSLLLVLIFNNYWTRLSKIVICLWRADQLFAEAEARLRQIIDLRNTDKSRCFAITEFNNCFIIRSPSLFF